MKLEKLWKNRSCESQHQYNQQDKNTESENTLKTAFYMSRRGEEGGNSLNTFQDSPE